MAETFGVLVIAISSLALFVLASVQIAHRVVGLTAAALERTLVLPELEELPSRLVVGSATAIAVSSQMPVTYLLGLETGHLGAASMAILVLEILTAVGFTAYLVAERASMRSLIRKRTVTIVDRLGARRRTAA